MNDIFNEEMYTNPEQLKRVLNAQKIKEKDIFDFDAISQTCQIVGSGKEAYYVSLDGCTCADFTMKHQPCKHMYKLAEILGLLPPLPSVSRKAANEFNETIPQEVERYKELFLKGAISAEKYCKIVTALTSK